MTKIISRRVKVNTGNTEIDNMLICKELSEWVERTIKILVNMGQVYNIIIIHRTTFTKLKLESPKGWEAMSENWYFISLMKGIKRIIFKHNNTDYLYTGMWLKLSELPNLYQVGMTVIEYHKRCTVRKYLEEDFG